MSGVHVLGVRHHGPGSARSVGAALDRLRPDVVVIEGAPELDALVGLAASPDLVPPVAALVYRADEPGRASFWPFAAFSPEWVALRWALDAGAVVRFADLPAATSLVQPDVRAVGVPEDTDAPEDVGPPEDADAPEYAPAAEDAPAPDGMAAADLRGDPIAVLARVAGYDDPERWWEDAVEHRTGALEGFAAIREAMAAIRAAEDAAWGDGAAPTRTHAARQHNAVREAAMRRVLRAVLKDRPAVVAVVCGAYHAPVLHPDDFPTQAADTATLRGLRKVKVTATWAPWTSRRLAQDSGYGAGVPSPGWYAHCFATPPDQVISRWMVAVARALRRNGMDASSASTIDAVRLAESLAALRGRPQAGLAECTESAQAVLCGGSRIPLQLVHDELVVGHALGQVPEETPQVPLARDLEQEARSARLTRRAEAAVITLDLRTEKGLAKSVLLHRLDLLDIRWGQPADAGGTTGTFKEAWAIQWQPELVVAVIEAGMWGMTVETAAAIRTAGLAAEAVDLAGLTTVLERALPADLPAATLAITEEIERRSAGQHDTLALMRAAEPVARSCRYGDVRGADTEGLRRVLRALVRRIASGLGPAVQALDDDAADDVRAALDGVHRAVALLAREEPDLQETWMTALVGVAGEGRDGRGGGGAPRVHGSVAGRVVRLLLDDRRLGAADARDRLSRELSPAAEARQAAAFLDGFLDGDATLLLLDHELLVLVDGWVVGATGTAFDDLLPLLRRTFARYSPPERRAIGERLRRSPSSGAGAPHALTPDDRIAEDLDPDLAGPAVAKVLALLQGRSA